MSSLLQRAHPLAQMAKQRQVLESTSLPLRFEQALEQTALYPLRPTGIEILQINVGKLCNQTCRHCHVDAGPDRRETMPPDIVEVCLRALIASGIATLDITGGAPELHPQFRDIVRRARAAGRHVIDRCNLTVLLSPRFEDLPHFLASQQVEIVASLPSFNARQTDAQRGEGVFQGSLQALRLLNAVGYGRDPRLPLNLVTNPVGAFLPPSQTSLTAEWKRHLKQHYDVDFDQLYTITNMPIARFLDYLLESGNYEAYMRRLVNAYNPSAAAAVMCRNTLSVGWDGTLYDCDFNQMLDLPVNAGTRRNILDCSFDELNQRSIVVGQHCFGCTAGAGSSCGGATAL